MTTAMNSVQTESLNNCSHNVVEAPASLSALVGTSENTSHTYLAVTNFTFDIVNMECKTYDLLMDYLFYSGITQVTKISVIDYPDAFWSTQIIIDVQGFPSQLKKCIHTDLIAFEEILRVNYPFEPPPLLLVGIELNPGPAKPKQKKQKPQQSSASSSSSSLRTSANNAPVSFSTTYTNKGPSQKTSSNTTRIKHIELVNASVQNSEPLEYFRYKLNPGHVETFPWLSTIADQYDQYKIHNLIFRFVPSCATNTLGDIYLSPEYDASETPPTSETVIANTKGTVVGNVWRPLELRLDTAALMGLGPRKFVRDSIRAGDVKTYDAGIVIVAVVGGASSGAIGKVFVEYDIEFFIPQVNPEVVPVPSYTSVFSSGGAIQYFTNNVIQNAAYGVAIADPLQLDIKYNVSTRRFYLPKGMYRVTIQGHAGTDTSGSFFMRADILHEGTTGGYAGFQSSATMSTGGGYMQFNHTRLVSASVPDVTYVEVSIRIVGSGTLTLSPDTTIFFEPA